MDKSIKSLINRKNKDFSTKDKQIVLKGELFIKWLKDLNFEPKLKYKEDNLYMASYLYWITRIERRSVLERTLGFYKLKDPENSKRVFKYLFKRLEHSLYSLAVKNRSKIKNIYSIKNDWMLFEIEGINYKFLTRYKLIKSLGIPFSNPEKIKINEYDKKVYLTLIDCIEYSETTT